MMRPRSSQAPPLRPLVHGAAIRTRRMTMARRKTDDAAQFEELLVQALETEMGGVEVYRMALKCVVKDDLRQEWEQYFEETQEHVQIVMDLVTPSSNLRTSSERR